MKRTIGFVVLLLIGLGLLFMWQPQDGQQKVNEAAAPAVSATETVAAEPVADDFESASQPVDPPVASAGPPASEAGSDEHGTDDAAYTFAQADTNPSASNASAADGSRPDSPRLTRMRQEREARMAGISRAGTYADPEVRAAAVEEAHQAWQAAEARANAWSAATGQPRSGTMDDGSSYLVLDVTDEYGPHIVMTHSAPAPLSTGAALLHDAPYGLTGTGITAIVIDDGMVRSTHQDFGGRVEPLVFTSSGGTTYSNDQPVTSHATMSAGTMIGSGAGNANAKGMAPAARILSAYWSSDHLQMTYMGRAAPEETNKVQISNHSYGSPAGWQGTDFWTYYSTSWDGTRESHYFGQYANTAGNWDDLLYNTPYYLPVNSMGNERAKKPPATGISWAARRNAVSAVGVGPYDPALHPWANADSWEGGYDTHSTLHMGGAKNILSVGAGRLAVRDGVRDLNAFLPMQPYSNFGPLDDGRIKPDLAGLTGFQVPGSASDTHYGIFTGTSSASPSVAGALLLLLEHYGNLFPGESMRAATIKALAIHNADNLEELGPNYRNGWGLLNVKTAADHLLNHHANEDLLYVVEDVITTNQPVVEYTFYWDEEHPIKATICWTDRRSFPVTGLNNRTKHLANDLDLRIIGPDGATNFPWRLDPENPWDPATKGDNDVDVVEQVYIENPPEPGLYTIRVTYKDRLRVSTHPAAADAEYQHFSLLLSGQTDTGIKVAPSPAYVPPAATATLNVNMIGPPLAAATVTVARIAGDADLYVSGGATLTFTEATWNTPQPVTIAVQNPYNRVDGHAVFEVASPGLESRLVTVYGPDEVPPAAITDLTLVAGDYALGGTLTWTAPLEAETVAVAYDLRMSTSPILDDADFDAATPLDHPPVPAAAGTTQTHEVRDLAANTTYYFAIKTEDVAGNISDLSNIAEYKTPNVAWVAYHNSEEEVGNPGDGWVSQGRAEGQGYLLVNYWTGELADGASITFHPHNFTTFSSFSTDALGMFPSGTDAHDTFAGILDLYRWRSSVGTWPRYARITFEGLEPGQYDLVMSHASFTSGDTGYSLEDVSSAVAAHSAGAGLVGDIVVINNQSNRDDGYVARWRNIIPSGTSGSSFSVRVEAQSGTAELPQLLRLVRIPGPTISQHPVGGTFNQGAELSLSVSATAGAGSLTYQWYQGESGDTSSPIGGATDATYNTPALNTIGEHRFWVAVTDDNGTVPSLAAVITIVTTDNTPPDAIDDLGADYVASDQVRLAWTGPSDVGSGVASYELRYSTTPITAGNFASATLVSDVPTPSAPGQTDTATVNGLTEGTVYYFAIRSKDAVGNVSEISNIATATIRGTLWVAFHNMEAEVDNPNEALVSKGRALNVSYDLKNYADGSDADGARIILTKVSGADPVSHANTAITMFAEGTPANALFAGRLGLDEHFAIGDHVTGQYGIYQLSFTNLPPGRYDVALTLSRPLNTTPTRMTLENVAAYEADMTSGIGDAGNTNRNDVTIIAHNEDGNVVRWRNIEPAGENGTAFAIRLERGGSLLQFTLPQLIRLERVADLRIVSQPASQVMVAGQSAELSVTVGGAAGTPTYQWYQGESGHTASPISGATNATYATAVLNDIGAYPYWVAVSDDVETIHSDTATITVIAPDAIPPEAITDLRTTEVAGAHIALAWTAPYDEGSGAVSYDLRFSAALITAGNFTNATAVGGLPAPGAPGETNTVTVSGLAPGTTYYFAIKTLDLAGNVSDLSNVLEASTTAPIGVAYHNTEALVDNPDESRVTKGNTSGTGYALKYYADGSPADGAHIVITHSLTAGNNAAAVLPDPGTDAHDLFSGILNLATHFSYGNTASATITFTNLPPGRYDVALTLNRGNNGNLTRLTLTNVTSFTAASSEGIHDADDSDDATVVIDSNNKVPGHVARWTNIEPAGDNGTSFSIVVDRLSGSFFYLPQLIRLEFTPSGPVIRTHPESQTINEGESATLTVVADGGAGELTYQWYEGQSGNTAQPISGATNATYVTDVLPTEGVYDYWVAVSDDNATVDSDTATITVIVPDHTPPEAIDDLAVTETAMDSISLTWTAPYDEGSGVASYEMRYSVDTITAANFSNATAVVDMPVPASPGATDTVTVSGLTADTTYYFALRSHDVAGNISDLSNIASGTTDPPPEGVLIEDFNAEPALTTATSHYPEHEGWRLGSGDQSSVLSTGGVGDTPYMQLKRIWCNNNPINAGIFIDTTDLTPGQTYYLQFDYKVGIVGSASLHSSAAVTYTIAENNGGTAYANRIDQLSNVEFNAYGTTTFMENLLRRAGPAIAGASDWATYTTEQGFTVSEGSTRLYIGIQAIGFGVNAGTIGADYTYLGIDNIQLMYSAGGGEEPPPPSGPTIDVQPQSVTIDEGETTQLSVTATSSGGALSYQWYAGTSGDTTAPIGGATAASYTTPTLTESASYWVAVTDDNGTTDSDTATVTVTPAGEPDPDPDPEPGDLLYYEGFDYTAGINLDGADGGTGWGGAWDKGGGASGDVQADGLTYTQGEVELVVGGRSIRNSNAGIDYRRPLSGTYDSEDDRTVWFSFLAYGTSGGRVVIDFTNDQYAYNRLGVGMLPASANWQVGNQLWSEGTDTGIAFSTNAASPDLILGRIQLNAVGDDVLDVWINPSLSEPPSGAADAQRTDNWTFDRLRVRTGTANDIGLDEIRIGETWASVVPTSGGEEPSDYDLWAGDSGLVGEDADPHGTPHDDGVKNLLKYALGLPGDRAVVRAELPDGEWNEAENEYHYTFQRARADIEYAVETTAGLTPPDWTTLVVDPGEVGQEVTVPISANGVDRLYIRLRVTER